MSAAALVIANIRVTEATAFEAYKVLSSEAIAAYGGRFLARGGRTQSVEGTWNPDRLTVLTFPSWQLALDFVHSVEYARARRARDGAAFFDMVVAECISEADSTVAVTGEPPHADSSI